MQGLKARRRPSGNKGLPVLLCYDYCRAADTSTAVLLRLVVETTKEPKPHFPPSGRICKL
jgi:hypothetical protein